MNVAGKWKQRRRGKNEDGAKQGGDEGEAKAKRREISMNSILHLAVYLAHSLVGSTYIE